MHYYKKLLKRVSVNNQINKAFNNNKNNNQYNLNKNKLRLSVELAWNFSEGEKFPLVYKKFDFGPSPDPEWK